MQILITDANIFIDFDEGGLIKQLFTLKAEIHTPDILFHEELADAHGYLINYGLKLAALDSSTLLSAYALNKQYRAVSTYDCMALALAKKDRNLLLTGDSQLRAAAKQEQVIVKGSIWLMEQLLVQQIISAQQAERAFNKMRAASRRLPWNHVEKLLAKYVI